MIELYTAATPNGRKVSIALEELGLEYRVRALSLGDLEQKQDEFLAINPNGRIPAIVDHDAGGFAVFESGAILVYLAEKTGRLLPVEPRPRSLVMQWLMFQMGGIGPMMGQANVFFRYAPERIEYAIQRYQHECRRLFEVLERRLREVPFLGGEYSIADIASYPWVVTHDWSGVGLDGLDALQAWLQRVGERPAVVRGMAVPAPPTQDEDRPAELVDAARNMLV